MSKRQIPDEMFDEARRIVEGDRIHSAQEALGFALVREAVLALLAQRKFIDEVSIVNFAMTVAGGELMRDANLDRAIKTFARRLLNGPVQVGLNP